MKISQNHSFWTEKSVDFIVSTMESMFLSSPQLQEQVISLYCSFLLKRQELSQNPNFLFGFCLCWSLKLSNNSLPSTFEHSPYQNDKQQFAIYSHILPDGADLGNYDTIHKEMQNEAHNLQVDYFKTSYEYILQLLGVKEILNRRDFILIKDLLEITWQHPQILSHFTSQERAHSILQVLSSADCTEEITPLPLDESPSLCTAQLMNVLQTPIFENIKSEEQLPYIFDQYSNERVKSR